MTDRPIEYSIATNVIGDLYVSTRTWHTLILEANGWVKTWETIVWEFDGKQRGKILKHIYHNHERAAIDFHFRYAKLLTHRNVTKLIKQAEKAETKTEEK